MEMTNLIHTKPDRSVFSGEHLKKKKVVANN